MVALAPSLCQENPRMLTGISLLLAVAGPLAPPLSGPPGTVPDNRGSASTSAASALDVIVSDMALMNDPELAGVPKTYGWAMGPGHVFMGNVARGTNTPTWWQVDNPTYKSSAWWTAVLPWFVIFDGVGHKANSTRVEVRDLRIFTQSRTSGSWKLLNHSVGVDGKNFP